MGRRDDTRKPFLFKVLLFKKVQKEFPSSRHDTAMSPQPLRTYHTIRYIPISTHGLLDQGRLHFFSLVYLAVFIFILFCIFPFLFFFLFFFHLSFLFSPFFSFLHNCPIRLFPTGNISINTTPLNAPHTVSVITS